MMRKKPSPVFAMWILITVALIIFIGISFSEDIRIGSHTIKKAAFHETLLAGGESEKIEIPIEINDTMPLPVETLVEPDTTVHSVLVFGDSMTHHLAMSISKYGTKNNYKVLGVTWESSSIPGWRNSGKIRKYMEMSKPDFVIISLGSNEMGLKSFERRIPDIKGIISQIGDIPYIWVGPPLWKEDKGLYPVLEKAIPKGKVFKIEDMDISRGPDHVHPTRRGADQWVDSLMRWIKKSEHPILTEIPDSGTSTKGHKFIYLHPND